MCLCVSAMLPLGAIGVSHNTAQPTSQRNSSVSKRSAEPAERDRGGVTDIQRLMGTKSDTEKSRGTDPRSESH